jgi:hypothetical protein
MHLPPFAAIFPSGSPNEAGCRSERTAGCLAFARALALGGSATAAQLVTGKNVKDGSGANPDRGDSYCDPVCVYEATLD